MVLVANVTRAQLGLGPTQQRLGERVRIHGHCDISDGGQIDAAFITGLEN